MSLSLNTQGFPLDLLHCAKLPKKTVSTQKKFYNFVLIKAKTNLFC